jgi:hypothetical protein
MVNDGQKSRDPDESDSETDDGTYAIAPDDHAKPHAGASPRDARRVAAGGRAEDADTDEDGGDHDADDGGDDSLPPPISRPASAKFWTIVAGSVLAFLLVAWLAGAPQLVVPEPTSDGPPIVRELGFFERLAGMARTVVYLGLATLGGVFGLLSLAFVRQRPVGAVDAMFAKVAAIVAIGMLLWLVPSDIRFIKQILNVIGVPLAAGALAIPVFRLAPRDAALCAGFTMLGMLFLVLLANTVVWAVAVG